jgi:hypothetical protein
MKPKVERIPRNFGQSKKPMSNRYRQRDCLTTEQLGELMIATAKKMSPEEKLKLRRRLQYSLLTKAERRRIN